MSDSPVQAATTPIAFARLQRTPGRGVALVHLIALAAAAAAVAMTADLARWHLGELAVIAALTIGSELTSRESGSAMLRVSGSFLGLVLAAVLLGGAPAACLGALTIVAGWTRSREAGHYFAQNLLIYAWFPWLSGMLFHVLVSACGLDSGDLGYYLLVFAVFILAMLLNFVGVAAYVSWVDGSTLAQKAREALAPVLASQLFSALLTIIAVYVEVRLGPSGLGLFGLVLVFSQYLVGELLVSQRRSRELGGIATDAAASSPSRPPELVQRQPPGLV